VGYIDAAGKVVISIRYDSAGDFSEGLAAVKKGKLWGTLTGRAGMRSNRNMSTVLSGNRGRDETIELKQGGICMKGMKALALLAKRVGKKKSVIPGVAVDVTNTPCSCRRQCRGRLSIFLPLVLALLLSALSGTPALAGQIDVWMQTPTDWEDRKSGLGRDLIKQVLAPGGVAVIEVYGARGNDPGVQVIADRMEQGMLARGATYLQTRLSESRRKTEDGHDAIFREYSGLYNGMQLRAIAVYTFGNGGAVAAFGFYAENSGAQYHNAVWASIASIRFTPPGAPQQAASVSVPRGGSVSGCDSLIGTWKWFTGKNHAFGPNGTSSASGTSWQCVDSQRRVVRITWDNGKWVDTLTISPDGKRVEGTNQRGGRVWGVSHQGQTPAVQNIPAPGSGSGQGATIAVNPKCTPIIGTWRSEQNGRTIMVTADGRLNGNPRYTWSCHPDGMHYNFRWDDGPRVIVWDDLRMDPDKLHLTRRQAGQVWDRFIKIR